MSTPGDDRDELVEALAGAYRDRDPRGEVRSHPAFHDLDDVPRGARPHPRRPALNSPVH